MDENLKKTTLMQLQVGLPTKMFVSIAIMAVLISFVYFFNVPNPNMILIAGLVLCSAMFGFGGGIIAAVIMFFYTLFFFSTNNSFTQFTPQNLQKVGVSLIGIVADMLFVCFLKTTEVRAFREIEELTAKQVREEEKREKQELEAFYKKNVERLSYQASHDELTGLYNRFGYDFLIAEVELSRVYLLMVDVDDFKSINDTYGHEIGDKVLIKIAETLKQNFRSDDYICRVGGDEFVVVMVHAHTGLRSLVKAKVQKINRALADTSDRLPAVSVSVGITFGSEASDAIELMKLADLAMYRLKRNGKQGYQFSDGK